MTASRNFTDGAVATPHYLATLAGVDILAKGGNAIDAMVGANLALGVVAPYYCGYGGDLLAMVYDGALHGYRSTGRSAAAASIEQIGALGHHVMPVFGAQAVTVPGAVLGWFELLERFGTMSFDRVARRAIELADRGFVLTKPGAFRLAGSMAMLRALGIDDSDLRANYPEVRADRRVLQPELGRLLAALSVDGPELYYKGEVATAIVGALQRAGGVMTTADLGEHASAWVRPLTAEFHGSTVAELPPPTQGVTALEMLRIADGIDLFGDDDERLHALIEIAKLGLGDRDEFVADPAAMTIDPRQLISEDWIVGRRGLIDPATARPLRPNATSDGGTAYMCCTDRSGMSISLIQSNFTAIGSGVHVPGWGINLHNRGSAFTLQPGHPNALGGKKLPMHTLIPAMVLRDGVPTHVFGTMGGHAQAQVHLQLLVRMLCDGDSPQPAIDAPRFHVDPVTGVVMLESRIPIADRQALTRRGHTIEVLRAYDDAMGHAHAIQFLSSGDGAAIGADPRAESAALGL